MKPPRASTQASNGIPATLFKGSKAKWLPLYHRVLARLSSVSGMEFLNGAREVSILSTAATSKTKGRMGLIRVTESGLEVGLRLGKGVTAAMARNERLIPSRKIPLWVTHRVLITSASQIDEEFLSWLKVARHQAGSTRPRSTSR